MNRSNAARVQGAGPSCDDGDPLQVCPEPGSSWDVNVTVDQAGNFHRTAAVFNTTGQFFDVDVRGMSKGRVQIITDAAWLIGNSFRCLASVDGVNFMFCGMEIDNAGTTAQQGKYIRTQGFVGPSVNISFHIDVGSYATIKVEGELITAGSVAVTFAATPFDTEEPTYSQPLIAATAQALPLMVPYGIDFTGNWAPVSVAKPFINFIPSTVQPWIVANQNSVFSPITSRFDYVRNVDTFFSVAAVAAGNTALWTPGGGRKFRLMRYMVAFTGNASTAGGAVIVLSLFDGGAGVTQQVHSVFCPAAALAAGALYTSPWIDLGNGYLSVAGGNTLNVNLSAALATGNATVIACGTEE